MAAQTQAAETKPKTARTKKATNPPKDEKPEVKAAEKEAPKKPAPKKKSASKKKPQPVVEEEPIVIPKLTPVEGSGKLIAVAGPPCSGKTSLSLKLAQEIYAMKKTTVIYLSPDIATPTIGYLFPNRKSDELFSVGATLDKTDIFREDVMKQIVTVKNMKDFGLLGYKLGENKYSYPSPTEDKVVALLHVAREIAAYVVVDCTCDPDDLVSATAYANADVVVSVITPTVKCMTYSASNEQPFHANRLITLNICDRDIYLPIEEVKAHFKKIACVLPYSQALKQQGITGTLSERLNDRKYNAQMASLARQVI